MNKLILNMVVLFTIIITAFVALVSQEPTIRAPMILTTIVLSYYLGHPMSYVEEN